MDTIPSLCHLFSLLSILLVLLGAVSLLSQVCARFNVSLDSSLTRSCNEGSSVKKPLGGTTVIQVNLEPVSMELKHLDSDYISDNRSNSKIMVVERTIIYTNQWVL